jgi:hypothetical protein
MIFPGMDPYLEDPLLWTGVHASLIVYVRNYLQPQLQPRYVAAIEERVFVEMPDQDRIPDVWIKRRRRDKVTTGSVATIEADEPIVVEVPGLEIHEGYVTILDLRSGQELVTVIEVVSPTNKYQGPGRASYREKQEEVRASTVHLVEIDLLRTGSHVLAVPERIAQSKGPYHYLGCVNRAEGLRNHFDLYPTKLSQRLPRMRIPLREGDADVVLDVQAILEQTYDDGCYDDRIDYQQPCRPPLIPRDRSWANKILKKAGFSPSNGSRKRKQ